MSKKNRRIAGLLLILAAVLVFSPLFVLRGAAFGGSDDAASVIVEEIGGDYEPWFTPVPETAFLGELPGEVESLLFCLQTGIGTGVLAFLLGRMVERKKWEDRESGQR